MRNGKQNRVVRFSADVVHRDPKPCPIKVRTSRYNNRTPFGSDRIPYQKRQFIDRASALLWPNVSDRFSLMWALYCQYCAAINVPPDKDIFVDDGFLEPMAKWFGITTGWNGQKVIRSHVIASQLRIDHSYIEKCLAISFRVAAQEVGINNANVAAGVARIKAFGTELLELNAAGLFRIMIPLGWAIDDGTQNYDRLIMRYFAFGKEAHDRAFNHQWIRTSVRLIDPDWWVNGGLSTFLDNRKVYQ